jgi:uncharacterized repeat protein (TIGR01451 family)
MDFGDTTGTGPNDFSGNPPTNVSHTYAASGTYFVTLTVTDIIGTTSSDTTRLDVMPPPTDLVVTKTAPASVVANNELTYVIGVKNHGPSPALAVDITDTLPLGVQFVRLDATTPTACAGTDTEAICNLAGLPVGASFDLTVTVVVRANGQEPRTITNTATADASNSDINHNDNTSTAPTVVAPNQPPVPVLEDSATAPGNTFHDARSAAGSNLTWAFRGTGSSHPDGPIATWSIAFGDSTTTGTNSFSGNRHRTSSTPTD